MNSPASCCSQLWNGGGNSCFSPETELVSPLSSLWSSATKGSWASRSSKCFLKPLHAPSALSEAFR